MDTDIISTRLAHWRQALNADTVKLAEARAYLIEHYDELERSGDINGVESYIEFVEHDVELAATKVANLECALAGAGR